MGTCTDQYTEVYCTQFATQVDIVLKTMSGIEVMMRLPIKKLKAMLDELLNAIPSDAGALADKLNKLKVKVDAKVPGQDCINELLAMANKCDLIKKSVEIKGINGLTFDLGTPINKMINQTLADFKVTMTAFAEYPVAVYCDVIDEMLKKAHIKDVLDKIAKLRVCADALCSGRLTAQFDAFDKIVKDLYLSTDTGLLDMQKIYAGMEHPLPGKVQTNIETCINEIKKQKSDAAGKLNDSVNSIIDAKNAVSGLF